MLKKVSFIIVANLIFFIILEISTRAILKFLKYPQVYKISNIDSNKYDFLTGYYNLANQTEKIIDNNYYQGTDKYGFNIDGDNHPINFEEKKQNEFRIFIVGGSTVQGRALKDRFDPISARLEKKLNELYKKSRQFFVVNVGTSSFMSSQELGLVQNRIIYALKPDLIIILNGSNDNHDPIDENFYKSNSHQFQRNFQKNINKQSKNFYFFMDDFLSKNLSIYFVSKKIFEKINQKYQFDNNYKKKINLKSYSNIAKKKEYRYFYNIKNFSKLSSDQTPILVYLQPQMLPENYDFLGKKDKNIYNKQNNLRKNYFSNKQNFYNEIYKNIDNYKKLNSSSFKFYDLSKLLLNNKADESFFSDHVHYTSKSREIISNRILKDINQILTKNK